MCDSSTTPDIEPNDISAEQAMKIVRDRSISTFSDEDEIQIQKMIKEAQAKITRIARRGEDSVVIGKTDKYRWGGCSDYPDLIITDKLWKRVMSHFESKGFDAWGNLCWEFLFWSGGAEIIISWIDIDADNLDDDDDDDLLDEDED